MKLSEAKEKEIREWAESELGSQHPVRLLLEELDRVRDELHYAKIGEEVAIDRWRDTEELCLSLCEERNAFQTALELSDKVVKALINEIEFAKTDDHTRKYSIGVMMAIKAYLDSKQENTE